MKRLLFSFNLIAAFALLLAHTAPYVNPNVFWPISFAGILFPYLVFINLFFVVFWLLVKVKYIFLPIIFLAFSWTSVVSTFAFSGPQEGENAIKIMSYNVKNFDLYNWSKNKETRDKMLNLIEKENPDILCVQEFFWHPNEENDNLKEVMERLSQPYYYYEEFQFWKEHHWGSAIFSKYPIKQKAKLDVNGLGNNISIYSDLEINGQTIRVYNLHLQSIFLGKDDYNYLKDISDMKKPDPMSTWKIIEKMKIAYKKRADQVLQIEKEIGEYDGKKIICGDFNDTPISFSYKTLSKGLQDAFLSSGKGMGKTFVSKIPSLRIDYILLEEDFNVHSYRTIKENLSDHYPLIVNFSLPKE